MPGLGLVRVWQGSSRLCPSTQLETCFKRGFAGLLMRDEFIFLVSNLPFCWAPCLPASEASHPDSGQGHRWTSPALPIPGAGTRAAQLALAHIPGQGSPEVTPVLRYSVRLEPSIFNDFSFLHTILFIFHFPSHSCWALLTRRGKKKTLLNPNLLGQK